MGSRRNASQRRQYELIKGHIQRVVHNLCANNSFVVEGVKRGGIAGFECRVVTEFELNESKTSLRESLFRYQNLESAR